MRDIFGEIIEAGERISVLRTSRMEPVCRKTG
jgi:hypothetical protein